ncbi:hypothetical protein J6590_063437 [Homalodisca vitripennis]|nr:hypothetical protein J6590_063437 [Homalodisca vitripennis]
MLLSHFLDQQISRCALSPRGRLPGSGRRPRVAQLHSCNLIVQLCKAVTVFNN